MRISDWSSDVCSSDLAIAADDAVKAEGDAGSTAFTFTVTRSGDPSAAGSVDYAVTGEAGGSDFLGGSLPGGTDRKSVVQGESVSVRVALRGRRILKKNNSIQYVTPPVTTKLTE